MLGLTVTNDGENKRFYEAVGNFLITFCAILLSQLIEKVPQSRLPTEIELFWSIVVSIVIALGIYGYNVKTAKS